MTDPTPAPTAPASATPATEPASASDSEIPERFRNYTPGDPAEIRRKMLFGVALLLALLSVYAGLLGWWRGVQYGAAVLAGLTALVALVSGAVGPPPAEPPR